MCVRGVIAPIYQSANMETVRVFPKLNCFFFLKNSNSLCHRWCCLSLLYFAADVDGAVVGNGESSIRDYGVYRQNLTINCHH